MTGDESGAYYTVTGNLSSVSGGSLSFAPGLFSALTATQYAINLLPGGSNSKNFYIDQKPNYSRLTGALDLICLKGEVELKAAHRDVSVNFKKFLWPAVDLMHTVETTATKVAAKAEITFLIISSSSLF